MIQRGVELVRGGEIFLNGKVTQNLDSTTPSKKKNMGQ